MPAKNDKMKEDDGRETNFFLFKKVIYQGKIKLSQKNVDGSVLYLGK